MPADPLFDTTRRNASITFLRSSTCSIMLVAAYLSLSRLWYGYCPEGKSIPNLGHLNVQPFSSYLSDGVTGWFGSLDLRHSLFLSIPYLPTMASADFLLQGNMPSRKISPGNSFFLQSIPVASTYLPFLYRWGFTMVCLLTRTNMPHMRQTGSIGFFLPVLPVRQYRLLPFGFLQCILTECHLATC